MNLDSHPISHTCPQQSFLEVDLLENLHRKLGELEMNVLSSKGKGGKTKGDQQQRKPKVMMVQESS